MADRRKDRRKLKRRINRARKQAAFGNIVMDCRQHPGKVVKCSSGYGYGRGYVDIYNDDCEIQSLLDGTMSCCSLFNCGPPKLNPGGVKALIQWRIDNSLDKPKEESIP